MLTAVERYQMLAGPNSPGVAYSEREWWVHQLFEARAARTPDATALVFERETLSYEELNRRANQLAHELRAHGVGPDVLCGVAMERSIEMVVALLAILKAGGAYVPFEPSSPRERLRFMAEDAGVRVLLTQESLLDAMPRQAAQIICVEREWDRIGRMRADSPKARVAGENLAYMIYTSGSTGRPKGAMNTHRACSNRLLWMQEATASTGRRASSRRRPSASTSRCGSSSGRSWQGRRLVVARPGGSPRRRLSGRR